MEVGGRGGEGGREREREREREERERREREREERERERERERREREGERGRERERERERERRERDCWLLACLTSQQRVSVSQGRICSDSCTCCHTETEVEDQTFYLTLSQYIDTGPTSPGADPMTPGA